MTAPRADYNHAQTVQTAEKAADLAAKAFYADPTPANFDAMQKAEALYRKLLAEGWKKVTA